MEDQFDAPSLIEGGLEAGKYDSPTFPEGFHLGESSFYDKSVALRSIILTVLLRSNTIVSAESKGMIVDYHDVGSKLHSGILVPHFILADEIMAMIVKFRLTSIGTRSICYNLNLVDIIEVSVCLKGEEYESGKEIFVMGIPFLYQIEAK